MMNPHLFIFTILGLSTLWTLRLIYSDRVNYQNHFPIIVLSTAAWILILFGAANLGLPFAFMFVLIVAAMIVYQYRDAERRQLLWMMAIAAQRGLPLSTAARAFSLGRIDEIGRRTDRLASLLDSGMPFPLALKNSKNPLPSDATVAVEIGFALNALDITLTDAAQTGNRITRLRQTVFDKLAYFFVLTLVLFCVILFMNIKIVPTYLQIMEDFNVKLPATTRFAFDLFQWFTMASPFVAFFAFFLGIGVCYGVLRYMGCPLPAIPFFGSLIGRIDTPILLRSFAYTIKSNRSILDAILVLENTFPSHWMRKRLSAAADQVQRGADWCESIREFGIISASDFALLQSAQRAGNLEWVLDELAELKLRRIEYRTSVFSRVLSPLIVILFAVIIGCLAAGVFAGLANMVQVIA